MPSHGGQSVSLRERCRRTVPQTCHTCTTCTTRIIIDCLSKGDLLGRLSAYVILSVTSSDQDSLSTCVIGSFKLVLVPSLNFKAVPFICSIIALRVEP